MEIKERLLPKVKRSELDREVLQGRKDDVDPRRDDQHEQADRGPRDPRGGILGICMNPKIFYANDEQCH